MAAFDLREPHTQINTTAQRGKGWSTPPMETATTSLKLHAVYNISTGTQHSYLLWPLLWFKTAFTKT